jgi:hypothetical protein
MKKNTNQELKNKFVVVFQPVLTGFPPLAAISRVHLWRG